MTTFALHAAGPDVVQRKPGLSIAIPNSNPVEAQVTRSNAGLEIRVFKVNCILRWYSVKCGLIHRSDL